MLDRVLSYGSVYAMAINRGFPQGKMITTTVCLPEQTITRLEQERDRQRRERPGYKVTISDVMRNAIERGLEDDDAD